MFLTADDLNLNILPEELEEITRGDDTLVTTALSAAVAEMRTYLYDSYDVDAIFAKTGTERHLLLVQFGTDMAIYYIVGRSQAGQIMDDRKARYDRALQWLIAARKSDIYNDLPRRPTPPAGSGVVAYGSNPKRKNYY